MKRVSFIVVFLFVRSTLAVEIEGVQPASLDQPRVHLHLRRELKGKPLAAGNGKEQSINIQAFLDTGASGVMLSTQTADALGVHREAAKPGENVIFHDVGVGGDDRFNVAEPLYVFVAPSGKTGEPDDASGYPISFGPVRAQVGPLSAGILQMLTGGLDVVGMPAMKGRVVVIDPKPVDTFADTMRAGLFDRNAQRNGKTVIPKTDRHIALRYQSFARFTHVDPPDAKGPTLAENPFIDGVIAASGRSKSSGNWLLDTGAAASMISSKQAAKVGVKYVEATEGTNAPVLAGVPEDEQFTITVGGVGGSKKAAGFFLDTLTLPTKEKDPIIYKRAPVLVSDITVEDPKTHERITLDGVFGMNFLCASAMVTEAALLPDIGKMSAGPYAWIVFDEPNALLGLKMK